MACDERFTGTEHPAYWSDVDAALTRLFGIDTADGLPDEALYD
ncbi:hypothetical protein [Arvimicrobium flavum]|nr:hypothetical protein [Mesorhizobium shangrilense]